MHAESKLEGLDDAVRRLKAQNDELTRQNQDLNSWKARLTQENYELQRQVQELDSSNGAMAKARAALQQQLDEAKARLDEESRVSQSAQLSLMAVFYCKSCIVIIVVVIVDCIHVLYVC